VLAAVDGVDVVALVDEGPDLVELAVEGELDHVRRVAPDLLGPERGLDGVAAAGRARGARRLLDLDDAERAPEIVGDVRAAERLGDDAEREVVARQELVRRRVALVGPEEGGPDALLEELALVEHRPGERALLEDRAEVDVPQRLVGDRHHGPALEAAHEQLAQVLVVHVAHRFADEEGPALVPQEPPGLLRGVDDEGPLLAHEQRRLHGAGQPLEHDGRQRALVVLGRRLGRRAGAHGGKLLGVAA
jgi:hypothetical protein